MAPAPFLRRSATLWLMALSFAHCPTASHGGTPSFIPGQGQARAAHPSGQEKHIPACMPFVQTPAPDLPAAMSDNQAPASQPSIASGLALQGAPLVTPAALLPGQPALSAAQQLLAGSVCSSNLHNGWQCIARGTRIIKAQNIISLPSMPCASTSWDLGLIDCSVYSAQQMNFGAAQPACIFHPQLFNYLYVIVLAPGLACWSFALSQSPHCPYLASLCCTNRLFPYSLQPPFIEPTPFVPILLGPYVRPVTYYSGCPGLPLCTNLRTRSRAAM